MMLSVALVALSLVASTIAGAVPSEPAPGTEFLIGQDCTVKWLASTDGTGKTTYVQLMSGSNEQMIPVTTVTQFDATDATTTQYTYKCPDVTLHSNVYFYQFTSTESKANPDLIQWTGRFTISNGTVDPAPNQDILPSGIDASWGNAALVNQADVKPAPPTAPDGQGGTTEPTGSTTAGSSTPSPSGTKSSTGTNGSTTKGGSSTAPSSTASGSSTPTPSPTGGAVAWHGSAAAGMLAAGLVVALL
ncbi:hypothetical protein BKA62DRAFT_657890 [Auriculariales sp. MPI-PUGE-AT-0066]|nr:hypothetical protein BKA62DRAFT_657890 [Auriculariales sp. MPI-PUGE-AT-0066]